MVPDTQVVALDTQVVGPDTHVVVADTQVVVPDTQVVVPDTQVVVPDTQVVVLDPQDLESEPEEPQEPKASNLRMVATPQSQQSLPPMHTNSYESMGSLSSLCGALADCTISSPAGKDSAGKD